MVKIVVLCHWALSSVVGQRTSGMLINGFPSICLSVRGMSVTIKLGLYLSSQDGSNSTLDAVLQGAIVLSIDIQCNTVIIVRINF